jgi:hypothetical protein
MLKEFQDSLEQLALDTHSELFKKKKELAKLNERIRYLETWSEIYRGLRNPGHYVTPHVAYAYVYKIRAKDKAIKGISYPFLLAKMPTSEDYRPIIRRQFIKDNSYEVLAFLIDFEEKNILPIAYRLFDNENDIFELKHNIMFKQANHDVKKEDDPYPLSELIKK